MFHILLDILLPSRCTACGKPVSSLQHGVCDACLKMIMPVFSGCPVCSSPVGNGSCRVCTDRAFYITRNIIIAEYSGVMKKILHTLKFKGGRRIHVPLGLLALQEFARNNLPADIITSVPMNARKRWKRGFNQSELIARLISKKTGIPYRPLLSENRRTGTQRELGLRYRFINALNRYKVIAKKPINGRAILIIDDVFTTGATINECARVLLKAGAREVFSIIIARSGITGREKIDF